jgi:hypothetical protein
VWLFLQSLPQVQQQDLIFDKSTAKTGTKQTRNHKSVLNKVSVPKRFAYATPVQFQKHQCMLELRKNQITSAIFF